MKSILRSLLIAFFALISFNSAKASHVSAADIYYEYLSPLTYKIHLVLYRDCKISSVGPPPVYSNSGLPGTQGMTAESVTCGQNFNFNVDTSGNNTNKMYGDLCPNINNWCTQVGSIYPGYEEWHYSATVVLPMACTDWVFKFDNLCCRNAAIGNLGTTNPGNATGYGLCISAGLNNVMRPINNSAFLSNKPIPYVCVNQPKSFLNGPLDPDFDSLVFLATPPLDWNTCAPIPFSPQFFGTAANPFGNAAPGGYVVNPNTGTATFTPTIQGAFVCAFTCFEIDPATGDTVGYVMRDVQLNVVNCNASPPSDPNGSQCYTLLGLTGGTLQPAIPPSTCQDVIETCPGSTLSFSIKSKSNSLSNLVTTYSNNTASCAGSTFSSTPLVGGNPVQANFSWTPTGAQVGNHTLIITFSDSTCSTAQPIVLKSYAVILIRVLPGVDAGPDKLYCIGADSIQLTVTAPPGITQWGWTNLAGSSTNIGLSSTSVQNPKAAPSVTTTYIVTALNPPPGLICKTKDTITITLVPGQVNVNAGGPSTICVNDSIVLNATATPAQINPTITWSPATDLSSTTILNPWASPLGTTNYKLVFRDDNGCIYTDYHLVNVNGARPLLNAQVSVNPVCPDAPFQLFGNTSSMPCGLSIFPCNTPNSVFKTVGTGNIQQSIYSPYNNVNYQTGYKTQMIYTAAELAQAGIKPGNLRSLAWFVIGKGSDTLRNFRISMGCTADNSFSGATGFATGLSQVFYDPKLYTAQGWNTHTFNNAYFWDGMTNLVVQVCYDITYSFSTNADILASSNTNYTQVITQNAATAGCNLTASSPMIGSVRPNTKFETCEVGAFTYSWSPAGTLNNSTVENPTSSGITNTTPFVITATATSNPNCVSKDTILVNVDNSNSVKASASPQVLCGPGMTTLTATPQGTAPQYYCGEDDVPCSSPFNLSPPSGVSIGSSLAVTPFNGSYSGGRTQMLFTKAELNAMGITKGRIDSFVMNVITKTSISSFNMNIRMGCTPLTQLNGFIPSFEMKDVYQNTAYTTVVGANKFVFNTPYLWDDVNNLVIELCFYNGQGNQVQPDAVDYSTTTNAQFYSQGSDYGGCDIPSVLAPSTPIISTARPIVNFYWCNVPIKPWKFRWDPALFVFDSTASVTTAYVNESGFYHVYSTGGNGCEVDDSVLITMSVHDIEATPMKDSLCLGDSYQAFATGLGNAPSESFLWIDGNGGSVGLSCTTCADPVITPVVTGWSYFTCIRTDTYGCNDSVTIGAYVYPNPNVSIVNGDGPITIKYGEQINLMATGGYIYNWTPVWGSSNPNTPSTIVAPGEPTMYYVYSINELGCRSVDSIKINIDYTDKLFIPTAFSPNGDGVNDLFKVANLTFQSIQEFKVMNRWGQEVFSAIDNRGWNGKYKGKDQDPATFYYLIKVAFPDGPVKTYKGDVILVR